MLICCPAGMGQPRPIDSEIARAKELLAQERFQEIVSLAQSIPAPSAELDFYLGTALARLGRLEDARKAFQTGARLRPSDERFPLELAGVAFKQKLYPEAARYLHRALELAPNDSYANDFLGTVYFLQENIDAALKYWNRVGKPQIAEIRAEPEPRLDPVLLDRAFAFSPASTLQLADLHTTQARIDALGIFPRYHFDLQAREDSKFSLLFRGLPWQSINPELYNLRHRAINFLSMWRWDAEKRRVFALLAAPSGSKP
ncbi:MAG TPA: tetratricopeptide repeat protein, partial [Terriglobales bacterium]|nr:tetratricopeptide repeat protein [Terriglobales bacterium]